jgi:protein-histidine pros-kinase
LADYELTARAKSGPETVVSCNATTLCDREGRVQGVLIAARATDTKPPAAGDAKDRFLATMSHELRTPLNAILGFTGTLLMKLPGPLTDDQETQLKTIRSSGRHLLSLIDDLLDLAKVETGKVDVHLEPVVCQEVIEEVVTALGPLARDKGLGLAVEAPEADVVISSDRRTLRQILINLASNAIKFTHAGTVRIALVSLAAPAGTTEIRVTDTGIGLGPEDLERLFQPFVRVRARGSLDGSGLGLHVSQKLAGLLGGRITAASQLGAGSVFTLVLR